MIQTMKMILQTNLVTQCVHCLVCVEFPIHRLPWFHMYLVLVSESVAAEGLGGVNDIDDIYDMDNYESDDDQGRWVGRYIADWHLADDLFRTYLYLVTISI